ncbi:MAG: hypothetical protein WCG47_25455 [Dermatophilaceae bacterium]
MLTVARALVDPSLARWLAEEDTRPDLPAAPTPEARLAAYEAIVHRRTTSLSSPTRGLQLPWPRAFGTPPWGALAELENGAAASGTRYRIRTLRLTGARELRRDVARLSRLVTDATPAVLYVGSRSMPRHVALVVPGEDGLAVYDPGYGRVVPLRADELAEHRLDVGGWAVPWFVVEPMGR